MAEIVAWAISALVVMLLAAFAAYLAGLLRLPMAGRPRTPTYDRFGRVVAEAENPDFHLNPGEDTVQGPGRPDSE